jgi:hypothetical protein
VGVLSVQSSDTARFIVNPTLKSTGNETDREFEPRLAPSRSSASPRPVRGLLAVYGQLNSPPTREAGGVRMRPYMDDGVSTVFPCGRRPRPMLTPGLPHGKMLSHQRRNTFRTTDHVCIYSNTSG